jgi:hypothetical protein
MLPSPSPQFTATAMWGPVLAWCVLQLLADEIDNKRPEQTALDLFDRLRLRAPFAQSLAALGFEGEEAWRVAARIKVLLLVSAGIGNESAASPQHPELTPSAEVNPKAAADTQAAPLAAPKPSQAYGKKLALPPALWLDPDVRWLCGVHQAEGHDYLIRERYEELLWWLLMPSLLRIAGESIPSQSEVEELTLAVAAALASAEAAGYRVDVLLGKGKIAPVGESPKTAPKPPSKLKPTPNTKPRKKRPRKPRN